MAVFSLCPHMAGGERALSGVFSKGTEPTEEGCASQRSHLQIPSHWGLGFIIGMWGKNTNIQSRTHTLWQLDFFFFPPFFCVCLMCYTRLFPLLFFCLFNVLYTPVSLPFIFACLMCCTRLFHLLFFACLMCCTHLFPLLFFCFFNVLYMPVSPFFCLFNVLYTPVSPFINFLWWLCST